MLRLHNADPRVRKKVKKRVAQRKKNKKSKTPYERPSTPNAKDRPLMVGRASLHDPTIRQPQAAKDGIVPKVPFRLLLSGASGSGKTNVARWILEKHYVSGHGSFFKDIYLMSPTALIDPVWKNVKGLKRQNRITNPNADSLNRILRKARENVKHKGKERGSHTLIIFDDVIAGTQFMNSPEFLAAFIRGRHFLVSVAIMTQSYVKIPRSSRIQASHIIFFPSQATEVDRLYSEHGPHNLSKRQFHELVQEATEPNQHEKWPFLYVDRFAPLERRFRRNLDIPLTITNRNASKRKAEPGRLYRGGAGNDEEVESGPLRGGL